MSRRITAILLQAALLALPFNGARADCAADHAAEMDMAAMPDMTHDADTSHHECPDATPQCDSMLVCGASIMIVEPLQAAPLAPTGMVAAQEFPRDPLSVTRAPEPPPPRA